MEQLVQCHIDMANASVGDRCFRFHVGRGIQPFPFDQLPKSGRVLLNRLNDRFHNSRPPHLPIVIAWEKRNGPKPLGFVCLTLPFRARAALGTED